MPAQLHLGSRCWISQHSATAHPAPHALVNLDQFKGKQGFPLACSMKHIPSLGQYAARITGRCTHGKRAIMLVEHKPAVRQGVSTAAAVLSHSAVDAYDDMQTAVQPVT